MKKKWQTKGQLQQLLYELVNIPSITGSDGEAHFPSEVIGKLKTLPYFQQHPNHLTYYNSGDDRGIVTALVKRKHCRETVVLLSHFDVVGVDDYGPWKELAFDPPQLTNTLKLNLSLFNDEVRNDLLTEEWVFGRGIMDMKCGLALHMSLVEKATLEEWQGNILLLTVYDEEANSAGMREAVSVLTKLAAVEQLHYSLCINSEPIFARYPGDEQKYLSTGSIGKLLPAFYCMGKETHAGEPFSGLNANYLTSLLTCALELNLDFAEKVGIEETPPPTNLLQKDLKKQYSVQIPDRSITAFNLLVFRKSITQINADLLSLAKKEAKKAQEHYLKQAKQYAGNQASQVPHWDISVFSYEALLDYVTTKLGEDRVTGD